MATIEEMAKSEMARKAALLGGGETPEKTPQKPALFEPPKQAQAVPPRNVPVMENVKNPNVHRVGAGVVSNEGMRWEASRAAQAAGPAPAAPAAPSPIAQQANSAMERFKAGVTQTASKMAPSMPSPNGAIGRMVGTAARGIGGVAVKAAPLVAPVIEGSKVAAVAMDPKSTKLDVATQAAEGVGKWGSTGAGAALGGGVGSAILPGPGTVVGAALGGVAGYMGGDALIKKLRSAVGLDEASPVARTAERVAAPVAAAAAKPTQTASAPAKAQPSPIQEAAAVPAPAPAAKKTSPVAKAAAARPKAAKKEAAPEAQDEGQTRTVTEVIDDGVSMTYDFNKSSMPIPTEIYQAGRADEYLNAMADNAVNRADPIRAQAELYKNTEGAASKYRADSSAGASIQSARIQAEADRYKTDKQAATEAEKGRIVTQEEMLPPDEMGVVKTIKRSYEKTKDGWKPIEGSAPVKPEERESALRQANKALAQGAKLEDVNAILLRKGIDPIKQ